MIITEREMDRMEIEAEFFVTNIMEEFEAGYLGVRGESVEPEPPQVSELPLPPEEVV